MKHEYEYDYADIEAYIRQANQLRSEALGQAIAASWTALKQSCLRLMLHGSARVQPCKSVHSLTV
ncbi:MAG: hypothetical protein PHH58_02745 [Rhodoferax sp.]|nr:hypothetical protein [Rhodoferax sp.]